jgi:hypothetical protein
LQEQAELQRQLQQHLEQEPSQFFNLLGWSWQILFVDVLSINKPICGVRNRKPFLLAITQPS